MIELAGVAVRAGGRALLEGIDLAVRPGELVALLGPNGAGKSTLLRAMCGDARLAAGEVRLGGRALAAWDGRELARVRAVLPQETRLAFALTALEVVLLGRTPHVSGRESRRDEDLARDALASTHALHLAGRAYPTLSGGEQRRVQLARALAQIWDAPAGGDPRYLLLDEPTASLDVAHERAVLETARRVARGGACVVVVLHDLALAADVADRVAVLHGGRLRACGAPSDVLRPALAREVFRVDVVSVAHPRTGRPVLIPSPIDDPLPLHKEPT